jgi:Ca2+:H+ antiporter
MAAISSLRRVFLLAVAIATALAGLADYMRWAPLPRFLLATLALMGVAWLMTFATDEVGEHLGATVTGALQATLANLPELFVIVFALNAGDLVVAQTAIVGSMLVNALLLLGIVIVVGARRSGDGVMRFSRRLPNDTVTLLLVMLFAIVFSSSELKLNGRASSAGDVRTISVVSAACLLGIYAVWLGSQLRLAARQAQAGQPPAGEVPARQPPAGRPSARQPSAGEFPAGQPPAGRPSARQPPAGHPPARQLPAGQVPARGRLSLALALCLLCISAAAAAFVSAWFIAALTPAIEVLHISRQFAGLVIVAIAGNAIEHVASVAFAARGRSDLAISIVKSSVAQIAGFLFPLMVLVSFALATRLTFSLSPVYIGALALMTLAVWQVSSDGEESAFEGLSLISLYAIVAVVAAFQ